MSDLRACSRSGLGFAAVCGLAMTALTGAALAEDESPFDNSKVIPSIPFAATGDTSDNLDDFDAICPYTGSTSPDVFYTYIPTADITLDINLCDSLYDTKVYVLDADAAFAEVGCNDDACASPGGGLFRSQLIVSLTAGTEYRIGIDGFAGDSGQYILSITEFAGLPDPCDDFPSTTPEGEVCDDSGLAVDTLNGGCNTDPVAPPFSNVNCGDVVCGEAWALGGTRDTDWYRIDTTDAETTIVHTATAQFSLAMGFIPTVPLGSGDCTTISVIDPFANPAAFEQGTITTPCLPAGQHWFFMGKDDFDLLPCGSAGPEGNGYVSEWACTTPCAAEPCPELGDVDSSGEVDFNDLLILLANYGPCP